MAIPFYYFWGWIRYQFTSNSSAGLSYFFESIFIFLLFLIACSIFLSAQNKFKSVWDYIIFITASIIFFILGGHEFIYTEFVH